MYSKEKLEYAKLALDSGEIFSDLRDPITRWFFKPQEKSSEKIAPFFKNRFGEKESDSKDKEAATTTTIKGPGGLSEEEYVKQLKHLISTEESKAVS